MKILKLILVCFFVTTYAFADISPKEKQALVTLYNSTGGDHWNVSWDINESVSQWHGVTVERNKVIAINLEFNNLEGELPNEIGNLIHLRSMNFGFNKLNGVIPKSLKNLTELRSLELFMNSFEGEIPSELGSLKKLESLKLYSNKLTGNIPMSFMGLTNLKEFLLGSNFFEKLLIFFV